MTIAKINFSYTQILLLALLLGAVIGDTTQFITYYFGQHYSDSFILIMLASGSFWLGSFFRKRSNSFLTIFTVLTFLLTVAITFSYELYQINEWTSTCLYAIISVVAAGCGWQAKVNASNRLYFIVAMLISFIVVGIFKISSQAVIISAFIGLALMQLSSMQSKQTSLYLLFATPTVIITLFFISPPIRFDRQVKYYDPLVFTQETPFQTIDITSWKGQDWFYYNNINQFSSIDHWLYFEPMAHVASQMVISHQKVLVIGGENGMLVSELLKYESTELIDLLPIDSDLYQLADSLSYFTRLNGRSLSNKRVKQIYAPAFKHLARQVDYYDLIFIDVPDPVDIELNQYYTQEFYDLCRLALSDKGAMVTQAGSPYFATKAFNTISHTISMAGFTTLPLHNQVLTLGEWGWVLGFKGFSQINVELLLNKNDFNKVDTKWLNKDAVSMMSSFGKQSIQSDTLINRLKKPIVHQYYTQGTWTFQ